MACDRSARLLISPNLSADSDHRLLSFLALTPAAYATLLSHRYGLLFPSCAIGAAGSVRRGKQHRYRLGSSPVLRSWFSVLGSPSVLPATQCPILAS